VQYDLHRRDTRARVIRQLTPVPQLALEDRVDSSAGPFDEPILLNASAKTGFRGRGGATRMLSSRT
jgi:hypothetical protein